MQKETLIIMFTHRERKRKGKVGRHFARPLGDRGKKPKRCLRFLPSLARRRRKKKGKKKEENGETVAPTSWLRKRIGGFRRNTLLARRKERRKMMAWPTRLRNRRKNHEATKRKKKKEELALPTSGRVEHKIKASVARYSFPRNRDRKKACRGHEVLIIPAMRGSKPYEATNLARKKKGGGFRGACSFASLRSGRSHENSNDFHVAERRKKERKKRWLSSPGAEREKRLKKGRFLDHRRFDQSRRKGKRA